MNKDFSENKLLSMDEQKQIRVLYQLASFIEENKKDITSSHFSKLVKYHSYLQQSESPRIQKLNKEFNKIKILDYQFQVYLMNLERLLGQSKKEYQFHVPQGDSLNKATQKFDIICLLDSVRSAHNVGAMFRNAECFGVKKMVLTGLTPEASHPQVIKTAMDTIEQVQWEYQKSAIDYIKELKKRGYKVWSIEKTNNSCAINKVESFPFPLVIIFGHEQFGVSEELLSLSDKIVSIDLHGSKNSLNVSVCQGIVLQNLVSLLQ